MAIKEIAFGELGLHPWEFHEYTMDDFSIKLAGFRRTKLELWHHTRALAFVMAKPHLKNQKMTIERFWSLPGDEQGSVSAAKSREEKMKKFKELRQWYIDKGHLSNN